jgi:hypothetical protein
LIAAIIFVFPASRSIRDLGNNIGQEIEDFVLGDRVFEVGGSDALGVALLGFLGGFSDEGDHEELQCFGCREKVTSDPFMVTGDH